MANYGIIRMAKFQMSDVQGIQKHNQRQGKSKSNQDIDESKSHLNYDLINESKIKYEQSIKTEISERVSRKTRANSVVLSEFLVTASPEYMQSLSANDQERYFKSSLDFVKKQYGSENVLYAVVHQDEANPHMHVGLIPITKDNRLSAKDIFNGKQTMIKLQDDFHGYMLKQGFELDRGVSKEETQRAHVSVHELKKNTEKEIEQLQEDVKGLKQVVNVSKEVDKIPFEESTGFLASLKGVKTVKMAREDFDQMKLLAKQSEVFKTQAEAFKHDVKLLKQERNEMAAVVVELKQNNQELKREKNEMAAVIVDLKQNNQELKEELNYLQKLIDYFTVTLKNIKINLLHLKMSEKKIDFLFGFAKVKSFDQINNGKATKFNSVLSTLSEGEVAGGKNYVSRFKEAQVAEEEKQYELTNDKNENSKSQTHEEMER